MKRITKDDKRLTFNEEKKSFPQQLSIKKGINRWVSVAVGDKNELPNVDQRK